VSSGRIVQAIDVMSVPMIAAWVECARDWRSVHAEATRKNRRRVIWLSRQSLSCVRRLGMGRISTAARALAGRFRFGVHRGDVVREVRRPAMPRRDDLQVGAEISGRIATVEADYNDVVKTGRSSRDSIARH